jgi:hypothetical protein
MKFGSATGTIAVPHLDQARANLEAVLDETCRSLPYGGDHAIRAFIARRLTDRVQIGLTTLGELGIVARKALADYTAGRSESSTTQAQIIYFGRFDAHPSSPDDGQ